MSRWSTTIKQRLLRGMMVLALGLACLAGTAQATPLVGPTGGGGWWFSGLDGVAGFQFTSNRSVSVTRLGVFDFGLDGLLGSHMVGLFDSGGSLLISATVEADAPIDADGYRWENLAAPYLLMANTNYVLGALYAGDGAEDAFMDTAIIIDPFTVQKGLYVFDSVLTMPTDEWPEGFFGPNLDGTPVPEPSTIILLGAGLAGMAVAARRRKS